MHPSTVFGTPATTNTAMGATFHSAGPQDSPIASRFGGNGPVTYSTSAMATGMVDLGFQGAMGDGTIHVACITQAGPEMLMRSQNAAYIAATHQIESLSRHVQNLEGQLAGQKQALAEVLSKVPILLGITGTEGAPSGEPPSQQARCACTGKAVLGLGLEYPTAPTSRPPSMLYWTREDFQAQPARGGRKGGQHKNDENVGQVWIEDEAGQVIDGYVAAQIHEMLLGCFHSLVWSGQAASQSQKLSHEGRVFIHTALGRHFPFLLLCQGGQWKINELIIQNYSSFAKTHLSKTSGEAKPSKRRHADSNSGESIASIDVDAPPAKAPKASDAASHGSSIPSSLPPSPLTNPSSHPLLEPSANLFVLDNPPRTHSLSPSPASLASFYGPTDNRPSAPITTISLVAPPTASSSLLSAPCTLFPNAQDTTSAPDAMQNPSGTNTHEEDNPMLGQHVALLISADSVALPSSAAAPDTWAGNSTVTATTSSTSGLPQIPVPKPFAVITRHTRHSEQPQPVVADSEEAPGPLPAHEAPTSTAALDQHQPVPGSQPPTTDSMDTEATASAGNTPAGDCLTPTPAVSLSGRRRGPPPVKASAKYKPETISAQSFHMRDCINNSPDITFTECQELFKKLSPEQLKAYQTEAADAKKKASTFISI